MIYSLDYSWVICTPPKTGTVSLQNTLVPNYGFKSANRHEQFCDGYYQIRILVIRNPLDRWASMYWSKKNKAVSKGSSIFLGREASLGINHFAKEWLRRRNEDPFPFFTDNLTEFAEKFNPTNSVTVKNVLSLLNINVKLKHNNKTTNGKNWEETSLMLNPKYRKEIEKWAVPDFKNFHYE